MLSSLYFQVYLTRHDPASSWLPYSGVAYLRLHAQGSAFGFTSDPIRIKHVHLDGGDTAKLSLCVSNVLL